MTVEEFYQYCKKSGLTDHKLTYSVAADPWFIGIEKDLEECDIEEHSGEIFITDHSKD